MLLMNNEVDNFIEINIKLGRIWIRRHLVSCFKIMYKKGPFVKFADSALRICDILTNPFSTVSVPYINYRRTPMFWCLQWTLLCGNQQMRVRILNKNHPSIDTWRNQSISIIFKFFRLKRWNKINEGNENEKHGREIIWIQFVLQRLTQHQFPSCRSGTSPNVEIVSPPVLTFFSVIDHVLMFIDVGLLKCSVSVKNFFYDSNETWLRKLSCIFSQWN